MPRDTDYPAGVVVFFRVIVPGEAGGPPTLARSLHPQGRSVETGGYGYLDDDYVVLDEDEHLVAVYPRDYVAGIMPLQTEGPKNAPN